MERNTFIKCPLCSSEITDGKMYSYMNIKICGRCFMAKFPNATLPPISEESVKQLDTIIDKSPTSNRTPDILLDLLSEIKRINRNTEQPVRITDIKMSFLSMVVFMVKWTIAAIPAITILVILSAFLSGMVLSIFRMFIH